LVHPLLGGEMEDLVPSGSARPYRLVGAPGFRLFCISNALWPCMSGMLSDNLAQFTPEAEALLTWEVLTMSNSTCLETLILLLEQIRDALSAHNVCCAGEMGVPFLEASPLPIERGIGDPPIGETWEEYDSYLCKALQRQCDLCEEAIDALTDALGVGAALGLEMLAVYMAPLMAPVALLLAILGVLAVILEDELFDQWAGELELMRYDLVCAAFLSPNPLSAKQSVNSVINSAVSPWPNKLLHKAMWSQDQLNRIFNGEIEGYEAYSDTYCETCEYPPTAEWHFDGWLEGWYLWEEYKTNHVDYDESVTHTPDGTGSLLLYGCKSGGGPWYARVACNTNVFVEDNMRFQLYHSKETVANNPHVHILFSDETAYQQYITDAATFPEWEPAGFDIPGSHWGKTISRIRVSWQLSDSHVWMDDVRLYVP